MNQQVERDDSEANRGGFCEAESSFQLPLFSAVRELFLDAYSAISVIHQKVCVCE